jgi:rare lipoprotein A
MWTWSWILMTIAIGTAKPNLVTQTPVTFAPTANFQPDSTFNAYTETGIASWYGQKFAGRMTTSGEIYCPDSMTAAHKKLPFGTVVRVTNLKNDSVVIVKITDRLPHNSKRCIDLSVAAATKLNFLREGTTTVKLEAIGTAPLYCRPKK